MNLSCRWEVWLLLIYIQPILAHYHELSKNTITYTNLEEDSYFGYSISYQASTKRLIVGAPKANVVGQIYTVNIDSRDVTLIETPAELKHLLNVAINESRVSTHRNFLHGATVKAGANFFVTCAPKTIYNYLGRYFNRLTVQGLCFAHTLSGEPYKVDDDRPQKGRITKPYGWSLDITKTGTIIMGAPAMYEGMVKVTQDSKFETLIPTTRVKYSFGYSVATGNYFSDDKTSLYYAISSPYGSFGLGKVLFYDTKDLSQQYNFTLNDDSLGSLYGASLCTVNLGGRRDYLLVGAPTYTEGNIIDHGAVHLYISKNTPSNSTLKLHKTIEAPLDSTAYFGSSIANLGDLDGDLKDEVAIGAPYEDEGRGAVYIYSGADLLDPNQNSKQMYVQRIQPEPTQGILSFGLSLTSLQDYDENGCNELAVGAPESNAVLVYKCFTYMTIHLLATSFTKVTVEQDQKDGMFSFDSCVEVKFPEKPKLINEKIRIQVKVTHPDVWFWAVSSTLRDKTNTMTYDTQITKNQTTYCKKVKVEANQLGNFEEVVFYTITASLIDDPRYIPEFNSNRVLLSGQSSLSLNSEESLANCEGKTCIPNLLLQFKSNMSNLYTVGSTSEGSFSFHINNEGDVAYTPCLLVNIKGTPLLRLPKGCSTGDGENIKCTPVVLLKKGTLWETGQITLDTRGLTSKDEQITATYKLYSSCSNPSTVSIEKQMKYHLISDKTGIKIKSESDPGHVVDIFSEPSRVRHVYTITNSGPTSWENVNIDIDLIKIKNTVTSENVIVEIQDETPVSCQMSKTEIEGDLKAYCTGVDLKINQQVRIITPFVVTPINGKDTVEAHNISTFLFLHLKKNIKESRMKTQLLFKKSSVPLWIILTASLLGLLILLLLGYILFKFGFLKRNKKGELVKLKRSVYRQSVQRMSMRHSKRESDETKPLDIDQTGQNHEAFETCENEVS